jgi:hypothetical protein
VFEECENNSDVYKCLEEKRVIDEVNVKAWEEVLIGKKKYGPVKRLFSYWENHCEKLELEDGNDLIKFVGIFSLAENVLRNTLLRPYIPAYRTINMNCGRYITSISPSGKKLFEELNFLENSGDLLTYHEEDPEKTVLYALTCFVFWHVLSIRLMKKR